MITKKTTIADLLEKYPDSMDILLEYGIECIGCHASPSESIEEGFLAHGMSNDEVNEVIDKINAEISTKKDKLETKQDDDEDSCCSNSNESSACCGSGCGSGCK